MQLCFQNFIVFTHLECHIRLRSYFNGFFPSETPTTPNQSITPHSRSRNMFSWSDSFNIYELSPGFNEFTGLTRTEGTLPSLGRLDAWISTDVLNLIKGINNGDTRKLQYRDLFGPFLQLTRDQTVDTLRHFVDYCLSQQLLYYK